MTDEQGHLDRDTEFSVSQRFVDDLGELFGPQEAVPSNIDQAVAETARRHLQGSVRKRWRRWSIPASAAAAAVIALACLWWVGPEGTPRTTQTPVAPLAENGYQAQTGVTGDVEDIDRNGQIDILDAFRLARQIESGQAGDLRWDLNGDGVIDRADVDKAAFTAVRLDRGV